MPDTTRLLAETTSARERAKALLEGLIAAQAASEANLAKIARPDCLKMVTGRSAIENAIASTRRMIETLERTIEAIRQQIQGDLSPGY